MIAAIAALLASALAAEPAALSLDAALEEAARMSPELAASQSALEAARKRPLQEATPMSPRVDIEKMYAPRGSDPLTKAEERSVSVTQELPFPTTLALKAREAGQDADAAAQRLRGKRLEVRAMARSAYAQLWLIQRSLDILEENVGLMRRFARVAESKYVAGHAPQSDALKAQLELTRMLNMRLELTEERAMAEAELAAALGRRDAAFGRLEDPALPSTAAAAGVEAAALSGSPAVGEAEALERRAGTRLALARSEYLPSLMMQYRRRAGGAMLAKSHDAVLGFTVPLWFWRQASMTSQAKAERRMAQEELAAARLAALSGARQAAARLRSAVALTRLYESTVLPQAEAALRVAESSYQSEKASFLDLLDAQRSFLSSMLEHHQNQARAQERLASLSRVSGVEL